MQKQKIAEKLIEFRVAKGLTQDDVAKKLEISNRTVSKWENGASLPDLPTLIKLAKCYDVSTDALLGLAPGQQQGTRGAIDSLFEGKNRTNAILTAFEIAETTFPSFLYASKYLDGATDKDSIPPFPTDPTMQFSSVIAINDLFLFSLQSKDVNLATMLLRNEANFAWLKNPEKQKKLVRIFRFLSDEETLSLLYFIHSAECSDSFTASYIAEHTGVSEKRAQEILDEFCAVGGCKQITAHFLTGDVKIYESQGDGRLLTMLSLAYAHAFNKKMHAYRHIRNSKMIEEVQNESIG
ncbi:MAG: helix-turn-helix transcriptional regulator [Clostridia bacterium]|nr:helix-turn-helix transcriptional regulator [Clostridia bacterium]